jgi:hypothetical protein
VKPLKGCKNCTQSDGGRRGISIGAMLSRHKDKPKLM